MVVYSEASGLRTSERAYTLVYRLSEQLVMARTVSALFWTTRPEGQYVPNGTSQDEKRLSASRRSDCLLSVLSGRGESRGSSVLLIRA